VSVRDHVRQRLGRFRHELARTDIDGRARALHIAKLSLDATGVSSLIGLSHERLYELTVAPKQFRGLRDLTVRVAGPADLTALAAVAHTPPELIRNRFAQGDFAYVGELDGRMLVHTWFHRGPEPFGEDQPLFPRWALPADMFWSYHAFTLPEARTSGVFVKVFQIALHDLFTLHGATRVRGLVRASNVASIKLHERTGFRLLGNIVAVAVPGARLVSWRGDGGTRSWLQRRDANATLVLPPAPTPTDRFRSAAEPGSSAAGVNGSPRSEPGP
jgi:hypothetical protein